MVKPEIESQPPTDTLSADEIDLRALFAAMDNFVFTFDEQGRLLKTVVTSPTRLQHLQPKQRSKALQLFAPPVQDQPFLGYLQRSLKSGKTVHVEYSLLIEQEEVAFEASLSPMSGSAVIWVAQEVTERKLAEINLKEIESRFRSYFNLPLVGIAITSPEKGWLDVNQKACDMLGYTREELIQLTWAELTHPEDLVLDVELFDQLLAGQREQYAMDKRYFHKNGDIIYTSLGVGCVRKPDGSVDYTVALMQDITERKQAEASLRSSEEELRAKAQELQAALRSLQQTQTQLIQTEKMSSLGQLVAGIAHEINNPVNFIFGNITHIDNYVQDLLGLIEQYQQSFSPSPEIEVAIEEIDLEFILEDMPKILASMKMGTDRIRQIVLSLRNFSRLDEAEMKAVDIHEGIDNTLLILQNRLKMRAGQRVIEIIKQYGNLPLVECFAGQLNQVFMNILANAIDVLEEAQVTGESGQQPVASSDPEPMIPTPSIQIQTEVVDSNWIRVQIADNGPGMSEATRRKLFEPFFTTKPVGKGTGLGLSISYQIVVEKHGGQLECVSTPGHGTTFIVTLPTWQQCPEPTMVSRDKTSDPA